MEYIQSIQRSHLHDVDFSELIAQSIIHVAEQSHLHGLIGRRSCRAIQLCGTTPLAALQLRENLFRSIDYGCRHACQARDVVPIAATGRTGHKIA